MLLESRPENPKRRQANRFGQSYFHPIRLSVYLITGHSRCVDKPGILLKSHGENLTPGQTSYAKDDSAWQEKDHRDLLSIIKEVKPHVLIGTSTCPKAFTEDVVKEMAKHVDRPMIFPLSNPTKLHEADPVDLIEWTEGKALVATGSPFSPVEYKGKQYEIGMFNPVQYFFS